MDHKSIGLFFVLLFFLVASTMLLANYKAWEIQYLKLIQASNPIHKKAYSLLKNNPRFFLESAGTLGILLSFAGMLGSKFAVKSLSLFILVLALALNYSTSEIKVADFQTSVLSTLSLVAVCGGLMQAW